MASIKGISVNNTVFALASPYQSFIDKRKENLSLGLMINSWMRVGTHSYCLEIKKKWSDSIFLYVAIDSK